jgi:hypothetical protein
MLGNRDYKQIDGRNCRTPDHFMELMKTLANLADDCLAPSGKVVLIVGEARRNSRRIDTSEIVKAAFETQHKFRLTDCLEDPVPDIRRSRRGCAGTKREWIMAFSRR